MCEPPLTYPPDFNYDQEIAASWTRMDTDLRDRYQEQFDLANKRWDEEKEKEAATARTAQETPTITAPQGGLKVEPGDEDVEMGDDRDSHSAGEGGGFTAVNGSGAAPRMGNI